MPVSDRTSRTGPGAPPERRIGRSAVAGLSVVALLGFVALLVAVVLAGGSDPADAALEQSVLAWRRPFWSPLFVAATDLGTFPVVAGVAILAAVTVWRRTRTPLYPAAVLGGVAVTASTIYLVKLAVARSRPPIDFLIGSPSSDYSFPSGHTGDGGVAWVLSALMLGWTVGRPVWRRALVTLGVVVALAIGCSRVYLGYHWASDVVASWLLALAVVSGIGYVVSRVDPPPRGTDSSKRHHASGASVAITSPP